MSSKLCLASRLQFKNDLQSLSGKMLDFNDLSSFKKCMLLRLLSCRLTGWIFELREKVSDKAN
jgi:hypothetical protein